MTKIKTGVVFDPSNSYTLEEEIDSVKIALSLLDLDIEIVASGQSMMDVYKKRFELLVIDYGGAAICSSGSANMQVWSACNYAENHPGTLVVIWTKYTARLYRDELQAEFGHLTNVLLRYQEDESQFDFSEPGGSKFNDTIRAWFASHLEEEQENEPNANRNEKASHR